jgi:hypothetical protein
MSEATVVLSQGTWDLQVERNRTLTLYPSLFCPEHHVHGTIANGKWRSLHLSLPDLSQCEAESKIDRAIDMAEQYGGGYWGAIQALAERTYYYTA